MRASFSGWCLQGQGACGLPANVARMRSGARWGPTGGGIGWLACFGDRAPSTYGNSTATARPEKTKGLAGNHRLTPVILGSPTWARTRDLRINSPALYRLSYRGTASNYSRRPSRRRPAQRSTCSETRTVRGSQREQVGVAELVRGSRARRGGRRGCRCRRAASRRCRRRLRLVAQRRGRTASRPGSGRCCRAAPRARSRSVPAASSRRPGDRRHASVAPAACAVTAGTLVGRLPSSAGSLGALDARVQPLRAGAQPQAPARQPGCPRRRDGAASPTRPRVHCTTPHGPPRSRCRRRAGGGCRTPPRSIRALSAPPLRPISICRLSAAGSAWPALV